jgi:hypothetical protein
VCIGIPWSGNQDPLGRAVLRLDRGKLAIAAGGRRVAIDTRTFALSVAGREGSGSRPASSLAGGAAAVAAFALFALRRRSRHSDAVGLPA